MNVRFRRIKARFAKSPMSHFGQFWLEGDGGFFSIMAKITVPPRALLSGCSARLRRAVTARDPSGGALSRYRSKYHIKKRLEQRARLDGL